MIYDCFTFFNELDLLEIRLNILDPYVDYFVLVEADKTHSNKGKPLHFKDNRKRFSRFLDKIIYIEIHEYPEYKTSWTFENFQRNEILKGLKNCDPEDIIIISDLDEIVNPKIIKKFNGEGIYKIKQDFYSFFLNYKAVTGKYWDLANIMKYKVIINNMAEEYKYEYSENMIDYLNENTTPTKIRFLENLPVLPDGGWHFTYLGGMEKIKEKLSSFSHQEFNNANYNSEEYIKKMMLKGYDLTRPTKNRFLPVSVNRKYLPEYIVNNKEKYEDIIFPVDNKIIMRSFIARYFTITKYYCIRKPLLKLKRFIKNNVLLKKDS